MRRCKFLKRFVNQNKYVVKTNTASDILFKNAAELKNCNKRIAVHLHLYYIDLADEFISYLNNIPFKFDLLISVSKDTDKEEIKKLFKNKICNVNDVLVEYTKNIGRDFSPMFIVFKNDILKYDYLLHIHSKKSMRTGSEQDGWRQHMLNCLLGDEKLIRKIFYQFENNNRIGLIYPETYYDMPYWAHTWLKNRQMCNEIASKLKFSLSDKYIDYSVGSFFWVNVKAIANFLNLNYSWDDFGKEEGKADGTLAHAIERMIPQVVLNNSYGYLVVDDEAHLFRAKGHKNLYQYQNKSKEECLKELLNYDIITFDIFDTLITRLIYSPSQLYNKLEVYVQEKYHVSDFKKIRQDAEYNVRVAKNFEGDCTLNEIYLKIGEMLSLKKEIEDIKQKEIDLELEYTIPRTDMLDIYNELIKNNKEVILISDMYLTSDILAKMLKKCGYANYTKLLVSSETNKRKDNGEIWNYYFNKIANNKTSIHVGDNEQSDIQQLCDMAKPYYHVMQPAKMYTLASQYEYLKPYIKTVNDNEVLGLIVNKKIYNSPFKLNNCLINNYHDFGYAIFGPLFFNYYKFLQDNAKKNKNDKLLFLAREGYYLQMIYDSFCKLFKEEPIKNEYLLTSRRSVSVANINSYDDAYKIISTNYMGRLNNLFISRLGIDDSKISTKHIDLNNASDTKEVANILKDIYPKYESNFKAEKESYKKYLKKTIGSSKNAAVVDLGYSGTIQYYLMSLLNQKYDGYYFTLNEIVKPKEIGGKCYGCYDSLKDSSEKSVLLFSMILETFLTAPFGQLIKFEKDKPVYKDELIDSDTFACLDKIKEGIIDFMTDLSKMYSNYEQIDISNEFVCAILASTIYCNDVIADDIKKIFVLENSYSIDSTINVFEFLYKQYAEKK